MPPAARVSDSTAHGGTLAGPGVPSVLIAGLPAAVVGTSYVCPVDGGNAVASGSSSVLIGGTPAARLGDSTGCGATITTGASSVLVGG